MASESLEKSVTSRSSRLLAAPMGRPGGRGAGMPGPSPDPATNILLADIALRSAGRLMRNTIEKAMLRAGYDREKAHEIVDGRTMLSSLALYAASKIATRSVPGALLVTGGLIAKIIYDRSLGRSEARARGEQMLERMAEDES